ncbi:ABC transporter permease [Nocardia cyriacigeorgica]|uniref:ABC transporter permease n=1 Tax=Nocardia cyriacigeorgica TaxID=135487 RepID=UPI002454492C|nr:ABC transporter permease [Nocardia cyriacigeorgica]
MSRFARLLIRRVALLIVLLAAVFAAVDLLPGSAARAVLGREATEAAVAAKERELGLDRPLPVRFSDWLAGVLTGDFGQTARGRSVSELLADTFPQTLLLGGIAFAVTIAASLALGAWWSIRPRGGGGGGGWNQPTQPPPTTGVRRWDRRDRSFWGGPGRVWPRVTFLRSGAMNVRGAPAACCPRAART